MFWFCYPPLFYFYVLMSCQMQLSVPQENTKSSFFISFFFSLTVFSLSLSHSSSQIPISSPWGKMPRSVPFRSEQSTSLHSDRVLYAQFSLIALLDFFFTHYSAQSSDSALIKHHLMLINCIKE